MKEFSLYIRYVSSSGTFTSVFFSSSAHREIIQGIDTARSRDSPELQRQELPDDLDPQPLRAQHDQRRVLLRPIFPVLPNAVVVALARVPPADPGPRLWRVQNHQPAHELKLPRQLLHVALERERVDAGAQKLEKRRPGEHGEAGEGHGRGPLRHGRMAARGRAGVAEAARE